MNKIDLKELRNVLLSWQTHQPETVLAVLVQISEKNLTLDQIIEAKLYKALKNLSQVDNKIPQSYSQTEFEQVTHQAKNLQKNMKELSQQSKLKRDTQQPILKTPCQQQTNLFEDFIESEQSYSPRGPVLIGISRVMLLNYKTAKQINEVEQSVKDQVRKITTLLEKELYFKNQLETNSRDLYQQEARKLLQFLKKDKIGQSTIRLLTNQFTIKNAVQLKTEDWLDDVTRKYSQDIQRQEFMNTQTGFYEDLKKREMGKAKGAPCRRCHKLTVYLIDERQIRRSDEPSTKYYECFNCNNKYRS